MMDRALYRMVDLPSDEPMQYVGVYVLRWGKDADPSVGFVEVEDAAEAFEDLVEAVGAILPQLGFHGNGSDRDIYYCEQCGAADKDAEQVPHKDGCPIVALQQAHARAAGGPDDR